LSDHVLNLRETHSGRGPTRHGGPASRLLALGAATLLVTGLAILGSAVSAGAATGVTVTPTITPNSGLTNGESVTLTASGLTKSSIGNILECNDDAKQPNVMVGGVVNSSIAVSCIAPSLSALVTVSASGDVSGTFKVVQGTVGPPCGPAPAAATCPATDSAGNSPTADAALYPCPPTPAQQAIGDVCTLTYGDEANDSAVGNILFAGESAPSATTTTGAAPAATTTTTKPPVTAATVAPATGATGGTTVTTPVSAAPAPTGTLASTGPGPAVGWLALLGGGLLLLGLLLLMVLLNVPRRAMAGLVSARGTRAVRMPVDDAPSRSITRPSMAGASRWLEQLDVGRRLASAPALARGVSHRVASVSTRTAAWLLGR